MNFQVECECGEKIEVGEGAAGIVSDCACGQSIRVPSSADLRRAAGMSASVSPELLLQHALADGRLAADRECVECGTPTDLIEVVVECESACQTGKASPLSYVLPFFFQPASKYGLRRSAPGFQFHFAAS